MTSSWNSLLWITSFGHTWSDSPMIFNRDSVTRENHWRITSLVTQIVAHDKPYIILCFCHCHCYWSFICSANAYIYFLRNDLIYRRVELPPSKHGIFLCRSRGAVNLGFCESTIHFTKYLRTHKRYLVKMLFAAIMILMIQACQKFCICHDSSCRYICKIMTWSDD